MTSMQKDTVWVTEAEEYVLLTSIIDLCHVYFTTVKMNIKIVNKPKL